MKGEIDAPNPLWPVSRWWRDVPNWLWDNKNLADVYFDRGEDEIPRFVLEVASRLREMEMLTRFLLDDE